MIMKYLSRLLNSVNFNITHKRTLFHESHLGVERFKYRKSLESQLSEFKKKFETLSKSPESRILTHDFKKFVYLVKTEEDFQIFSDLLERYAQAEHSSERNIKFQIFNIGPEILKVYYAMNKPVEAFTLLKKPHIFSLICNLRSLVILQDLLYNNGFYQEVCDVFDIVKKKQFYGRIFHFAPYVLCQAACYKLDTSESYENVIALYRQFTKVNSKPVWPYLMYTLMFALKHNSLHIPIKYAVGLDPASVNIKLSALIKSENYSDALSFCNTLPSKSAIMKSVAEDLCKSLENDEIKQDESLMKKLHKFKEEIGKQNLISKTLDEVAADVISTYRSRDKLK